MTRKEKRPPAWALRFFRWYCHPKLVTYIEGDLMELYDVRLCDGKRKADVRFIFDVLLLFRPGIIRPSEGYQNINQYAMLRNYFKIGWRNLAKNKGYAIINVGGLALGMTVAMLIGLWVHDELTFDRWHQNYDGIVRVMQHQTTDGVQGTQVSIPRPLEFELRNTYGDDFVYLSMASWTGSHILTVGDQKISKTGIYAQADFPKMITPKMTQGTVEGYRDPSGILISVSTAKALFGDHDALNQAIRVDGKMDAKVVGVYEDFPHNTTFNDLQFICSWDLYLSSEPWLERAATQWGNNSFPMFAQIRHAEDAERISAKIKDVKLNKSKDEAVFKPEIFLSPMRDWHLHNEWKNGKIVGGRIRLVWLFGVIGSFVLLLACINFMNLSTARSEKRAKEVGIRMTIGSVRSQLIKQFLTESFLVVFLAFLFAILFLGTSLSWFNELANKQIVIPWSSPVAWMLSASFIIITTLLAGSYPSLYLSSFRPATVLKGSFKSGRFASVPRKILVVIQFTVSVTLIIGTTIVYKQIEFTKNRPIGFSREGLVMIQMKSPEFYGKYDVLRSALKDAGAIQEMSESSSPLTGIWSNSNNFSWPGKDPNLLEDFGTIFITPEYGETVSWTVKEGRNLSLSAPTDTSAVLVNEAAVAYMGVKDPVGMEITWGDDKLHIIGVVKNMLTESPYNPVRQTIYMLNFERVNWINLKLNPDKSAHESMALVETIFKKLIPTAPFDYKFVDDEFAWKFDAEERIGKLASVFAVLAIFISCLGLFGLASFVAEQRTKEIGIRKVLGASIAGLWRMLSTDFIVLVIISCIISIPIAYTVLNHWLMAYHYHTDISWWIFAASAAGAICITLLTVSYQAVRSAMASPVKSLRSE